MLDQYDELVTVPTLRTATRRLFADSHYARAVEESFKCLNNSVKAKSGIAGSDGASLMQTVFSAKSPILKLNSLRSQSDKDEQLGYMGIYAGVMTGIRNPRAHEYDLEDDPQLALELLNIANHLMRKLEAAQKSRSEK